MSGIFMGNDTIHQTKENLEIILLNRVPNPDGRFVYQYPSPDVLDEDEEETVFDKVAMDL
ncbi:hypothetical protein TMatcc_007958 [Talaromyces marneffei ATCC 18224]